MHDGLPTKLGTRNMVKAEIHKSSQTLISFNTNELHGLYTDIYTTIIIHITLLRFLFGVGLLPNVILRWSSQPRQELSMDLSSCVCLF